MSECEEDEDSNSPSQTIKNFFKHFNKEDELSLNQIFDAPCVFIIDNKTNLFKKYSDAVDFDSLRKSGWRYSRINSLEVVYEDSTTSMIRFSFSRLNESDDEISHTDAAHILVKKDNKWKIKAVFIHGSLDLR